MLRSESMQASCQELAGRLRQEDGAAVAVKHIRKALKAVHLTVAAPDVKVLQLANGWPVKTASLAEAAFMHEEIFVQQCYLQHGLSLRPGHVVVDVGANIGAQGHPMLPPQRPCSSR